MDVIEAITTRKSIRAYKPDPIKKETIEEILKIAVHAPSGTNAQPWEFTVITGKVLETVKQANVELVNSKTPPNPDFFYFENWPPESGYHKRKIELAKQIFQLVGIPREDIEKRRQWLERGFRFFDAPAAIIISEDRSIPEANQLIDIGTIIQSICLAALNYGLGTCIEYQGIMYPEVLRKFGGILESKRILVSIAIGYPDWDFPANKLKSTRQPIEDITRWCGFE